MARAFDYIIVGSGCGGCVVASRLHQRQPDASILLIEAGPDPSSHPLVPYGATALMVRDTELNYNYSTLPQKHLDGRTLSVGAGRALGGSTAINSGSWVRGPREDYDAWAKLVGDSKWSYSSLLPYFRKTESFHDRGLNPEQHGYDGPIHTQTAATSGRRYPLREEVKSSWMSTGIQENLDSNAGSVLGLMEYIENWREGKRQLASDAYPLHGVEVMLETLAKRAIIEERGDQKVAVGVELADGTQLMARVEVIVSGGAVRTPQILMLSGIGPREELSKHGIDVVLDAPYVGKNLHDHLHMDILWRLRDPDAGLSLGSHNYEIENGMWGLPLDWLANLTVPTDGLKEAIAMDKGNLLDEAESDPSRAHIETFTVYVGASSKHNIPLDGSHVRTIIISTHPTSRGSITLASADPNKSPAIDHNFCATEHDRYVARTGLKMVTNAMLNTAEGKDMVVGETPEQGQPALSTTLSDELLDQRVRDGADSFYHPAGTASMGKVVDTELRVFGVNRLRVVDASVIPLPMACHYQIPTYALAEQAVDLMLG